MTDQYDLLAGVYEWLVPDELLTPEGSVAAFAGVVDTLEDGARVLDCAAGIGQLAVGLALRGFDVVASDASPAMVERTRGLAEQRGATLSAVTSRWEDLNRQGWRGSFDAVFCVGNSLAHAAGKRQRLAALREMSNVLRPGGLLVVTSRNWEMVRQEGSGLQVADRLTERMGHQALVIHAWTIPEDWEEEHFLDVAVAHVDHAGGVTAHRARLSFWPFRHGELDDELRAAELSPESTTYAGGVERYLVTARRDPVGTVEGPNVW